MRIQCGILQPLGIFRLLGVFRDFLIKPIAKNVMQKLYMPMYLSGHGRLDIAGRIVRNCAKYGWMQMMDRGATTLWGT